ncbi:TetR family transcriptional regulator [Streptomyces sp. SID9727]|uniref:TetR/AcrR family transcriptional regulator n=1 Tax=Streptomyces sp. SID9727 TaxID=2706114 RepID=UPI0013CCF33D|nr:TetR family transcriptional regulator [Streptomyces sp. SID9727]
MERESESDEQRRPEGVPGVEVPETGPQRRPGSHDPEGNRRAVLDAARRLFGAHGYTGVGVRAIAAEAGVTPGLVMAYFGTKDALFGAAVAGGAGVGGDVLAAGVGPGEVPGVLARAYLDRWDRLPAEDPWPALIRSAVSHPPSAEMLRTILDRQVGEPLAQVIGTGTDADVRASMVRSVLFGVIMERYVFAHEPAASVPTAELAPALTEVLAAAFGGPPEAATRSDFTAGAPAPGEPPTGGPRPGRPAAGGASGHILPRPAPCAGPPPAPTHAGACASVPERAAGTPRSLFALLNACAARHQLAVGRALRAHGLSPAAFDVLDALREAGAPYRMTMGEVAAAGAGRAGGLTQQADRLAEAGLIRRERDSGDRRIVWLCLTARGVELTDRVAKVRAAQERELLSGMAPEDRRRLTELLRSLGKTLGAGGQRQ